MRPYAPIDESLRELILAEIGAECLAREADSKAACFDESKLNRRPELVLSARNAQQVSRLLKLANERNFPVTPRGAGTGLAGGALAEQGGVVLCLHEMDRIIKIDADNLAAEVEPGVILKDLRAEVEKHGLFYPPDPASLDKCSVGGTAATDAGGPACVKYGTTRQYVLGLEAVLPTGEIVSAGTRTRKGVVGYDLARLIVGSEGTLGVITRLFLRLVPKPRAAFAQVAVFRDLPAATRAVAKVMAGGVTPSAIEFLDEKCVELVRDLLPFADVKPGSALLLLETDGMEGPARQEMLLALDMVRQCGATHFLPAEDEAARQRLWAMRRALGDRLHEKWPVCVPEDVAVPLTSIADTVAAIPAAEERHGVTIYAFGHAGDGNVHLNIATDDQAKLPAVEAAIREMIGRVLEMGGTISGEHGIGLAKKPYLPLELTPESIRLQRAIKWAFDPNDILNPGKIF